MSERGALASDFGETECQTKCGVLLERSLPGRERAKKRRRKTRTERESTHKRVFRIRDVSARYPQNKISSQYGSRACESENAKQKNDSDSDSLLNIYAKVWGILGVKGLWLMKTKVFASLRYAGKTRKKWKHEGNLLRQAEVLIPV